jgi:hypothetical protein
MHFKCSAREKSRVSLLFERSKEEEEVEAEAKEAEAKEDKNALEVLVGTAGVFGGGGGPHRWVATLSSGIPRGGIFRALLRIKVPNGVRLVLVTMGDSNMNSVGLPELSCCFEEEEEEDEERPTLCC